MGSNPQCRQMIPIHLKNITSALAVLASLYKPKNRVVALQRKECTRDVSDTERMNTNKPKPNELCNQYKQTRSASQVENFEDYSLLKYVFFASGSRALHQKQARGRHYPK